MAPSGPTAAWTCKSASILSVIAEDKNFPKLLSKFMKETSKKRSKTILGTAGSYIVSRGKLRHVLLPVEISACIDDTGDDQEYMLANSSSAFNNMKPCLVSMTSVGATVLHFIEESKIPTDIKADYHIGTPFVKSTPAAAALTSYFPSGKEDIPHVLISVPINLPIDGGMTLASGAIEDAVNQTVQVSHGSHGTFFLDTMVDHVATIQATALTNKAALKDHFPNSKATGTVTVPTPNVTIQYTNVDMEDILESELVSLGRRMPPSPDDNIGIPSSVGGNGGVMDSNSGKKPPTHSYSSLLLSYYSKETHTHSLT